MSKQKHIFLYLELELGCWLNKSYKLLSLLQLSLLFAVKNTEAIVVTFILWRLPLGDW